MPSNGQREKTDWHYDCNIECHSSPAHSIVGIHILCINVTFEFRGLHRPIESTVKIQLVLPEDSVQKLHTLPFSSRIRRYLFSLFAHPLQAAQCAPSYKHIPYLSFSPPGSPSSSSPYSESYLRRRMSHPISNRWGAHMQLRSLASQLDDSGTTNEPIRSFFSDSAFNLTKWVSHFYGVRQL